MLPRLLVVVLLGVFSRGAAAADPFPVRFLRRSRPRWVARLSVLRGPRFRIGGDLGGWAPGERPWDLPEGVGMLRPKGARVVFNLVFNPNEPPRDVRWGERTSTE